MGHYRSEMDPNVDKDNDRLARQLALKEAIKDIPLGYFRVGDLQPLFKLFVLPYRPWDSDLEQLEDRLKEIQEKKVLFEPRLEE